MTTTKEMIKNKSKRKIISENRRICKSVFSKFKGLMFSKKTDNALVFAFEKENFVSLHMGFVFYAIDVLFLDKNKVIVDMKENFRPFTFYTSRKKCSYAIELPNGAIKKTKTEIGDKIDF